MTGKGIENSALIKRARAKYLSKSLAVKLAEKDSFLRKSYRNSIYCCDTIHQTNKKMVSKYCKNRWCAICNRIRTAQLINTYHGYLSNMRDKNLVTLTMKTVNSALLQERIFEMKKTFQSINVAARRRKQRNGIPFNVLRKLECTVRPGGKYHPHFHLIVQGADTADWIVQSWLRKNGSLSNVKAQDVRTCDDKTVMEIFKYFTKVTYKSKIIDTAKLDVIFRALYKKRIFQPYGIFFGKSDGDPEDINDLDAQEYEVEDLQKSWGWHQTDWVDQFGECLTNYTPNQGIIQIASSIK